MNYISNRSDHRIDFIEVGQFVMISRVYPQRTAWFWLGRQNPTKLADEQYRVDFSGWRKLQAMLRTSSASRVFVHVPIRNRFLTVRHAIRLLHNDFSGYAYQSIIDDCEKPIIGLDFNDDAAMSDIALRILDRCIVYFKRELSLDRNKLLLPNATAKQRELFKRNEHKLRPMSLGICQQRLDAAPPAQEKEFDLFYSGTPTSELRKVETPLLETIRKAGLCVHVPRSRTSLPEFLNLCAKSHMVWSPEGYGWDCFRHYESALCSATPLMNTPTIEQHQAPRHGGEAIYYEPNSANGFVETAIEFAKDKDRLVEVGRAARTHALKHHTHRQMVDHILQSTSAPLVDAA